MTLGKSFPFPILSEDSMDYIDGAEYSSKVSYKRGAGVVVSHEITRGNFVSRLISQNVAKFACLVSRPSSMFRKIFVYDGHDGSMVVNQMIAPSDFYASEILEESWFRPIVVANQNINETICSAHSLDSTCWGEGEVIVPRGGIIAFDNWKRLTNETASSFLEIKVSGTLPYGRISVGVSTENGFKFIAYMSQGMLDAMKKTFFFNKEHVRSICTHALSRGFEILATDDDYNKDWQDSPYSPYLNILAAALQAKGASLWDEEGFKPEIAATALEPHALPEHSDEDYDA